MPTQPTTQAGHRAALHPRLARAIEAGIEAYVRAYPGRARPVYTSSWRPQLDCSRRSGPCASNSRHSRTFPATAADVDAPTWTVGSDPQGHAAQLARLVQQADPGIVWGGVWRERDYVHFELPSGPAGIETAVVSAAAGVPHAVAQAVDALAARMGVPAWSLYLGGGVALASLLASASNRL